MAVHPAWSRAATLYQVNTRQFTPEGTFAAAERELPRLAELGVDILYLMPIHPIGEAARKGRLGSPYAVRDYRGVNPEFGTLDDLRSFVAAARAQGQHVILDWVANHTARDSVLREAHPEWFAKDPAGDFRPTPWCDWTDVIDLDFEQPGLRRYMAEAMKYWVRETGIEGFRCDVAGFVPLDFWESVRKELDAIRPVFMLAEWESRDLHAQAFDASYAWTWYAAVRDTVAGDKGMEPLTKYYSWNENAWPRDAYRMTYVSNHDVNAWEATEFEAFGDALDAAIVLSVTGEGMPLVYNGQEAGNTRRLAFFERDPIEWREHRMGEFYRRLIALKKAHPALHNGASGGRMRPVANNRPDAVFSFLRAREADRVFVALNFSPLTQRVRFSGADHPGTYRDAFDGTAQTLAPSTELELPPWGHRVLTAG